MRVVTVVGTRPQLIKAAALQPAIRERHEELLVDTGQHWDDNLAGTFFRQLGLAPPDFTLNAGGGSHTQQTAAILAGLEPILVGQRPDAVLVYGDTNSTLGGALAAAQLGIPVAHVEAGLRKLRSPHARGDQPHRRRPPLALAVRADADGRRESRQRGSPGRRAAGG